jgi:hypothetical protein
VIHPLPEEGLVWIGKIYREEYFEMFPHTRKYAQEIEVHGEILQSQIAYATSVYLRGCDVVFFTLECASFRGEYVGYYSTNATLRCWLYDMNGILVAGQISIPMPVS